MPIFYHNLAHVRHVEVVAQLCKVLKEAFRLVMVGQRRSQTVAQGLAEVGHLEGVAQPCINTSLALGPLGGCRGFISLSVSSRV